MRRLFCALLLIFFAVSAGADDLTEQEKLKQIEKQLAASREKLEKTKEEEQAVLGRLAVINKDLKRTRGNLNAAFEKIKKNETKISYLTSELNEMDTTLKEKKRQFTQRVAEVYKGSSLNNFNLLFTSSSMSDFFNRLYFFQKIVDYDSQLVSAVKNDLYSAQDKRAQLTAKTAEIKSLAKVITEQKNDIASKAEEKTKLYKSLKQRRQEYEAQVAELEKSSKELEVLILKKGAGGKVRGSGVLAWPLQGRITSVFGYRRHPLWGGRDFHTGIDIAAKMGTPIKAADAGEIILAGWWDGYGKAIVIDHGHSTTTVYGHMSRLYKKVGDVVAKGQVIGLVGSTGYSTGPHLHFEVRKNGKPTNPRPFLD